jgi:murein DD-endopeptidase MepM/ murein hydrolase activator NlpD
MRQFLSLIGLLVLLAACEAQQEVAIAPTFTPTPTLRVMTAIPTIALASETATPTETASPTETLSPTDTPIPLPTNTPEVVASNTPTTEAETIEAASSPSYEHIEHYWLKRPIAIQEGNTHWLDRTYPYGGTAFGAQEVHLGVEFVNPRFTPVLAAGRGTVLYAGTDENQRFGPNFDYYGNLVVIEHPFPSPDGQTVYTLYAHLQDIAVQTGDTVNEGQEIGRIGDTGIAVGPHLHFEVRVGDPQDFHSTRNPDMWILPYPNSGTLIGRVSGLENPYGITVLVRSTERQLETYTYGGDEVNSDPSWGENFTLGDLPEGSYEILISDRNGRNYFRQSVSIVARVTSWVEIDLAGSGYER